MNTAARCSTICTSALAPVRTATARRGEPLTPEEEALGRWQRLSTWRKGIAIGGFAAGTFGLGFTSAALSSAAGAPQSASAAAAADSSAEVAIELRDW